MYCRQYSPTKKREILHVKCLPIGDAIKIKDTSYCLLHYTVHLCCGCHCKLLKVQTSVISVCVQEVEGVVLKVEQK